VFILGVFVWGKVAKRGHRVGKESFQVEISNHWVDGRSWNQLGRNINRTRWGVGEVGPCPVMDGNEGKRCRRGEEN